MFTTQQKALDFLGEMIKRYGIGCIVLGNPIKMNGTQGTLCEDVRRWSDLIENSLNTKVVLWDERLSTAQAERILKDEHKLTRKKRINKTDSLSAVVILDSFLENKNF